MLHRCRTQPLRMTTTQDNKAKHSRHQSVPPSMSTFTGPDRAPMDAPQLQQRVRVRVRAFLPMAAPRLPPTVAPVATLLAHRESIAGSHAQSVYARGKNTHLNKPKHESEIHRKNNPNLKSKSNQNRIKIELKRRVKKILHIRTSHKLESIFVRVVKAHGLFFVFIFEIQGERFQFLLPSLESLLWLVSLRAGGR